MTLIEYCPLLCHRGHYSAANYTSDRALCRVIWAYFGYCLGVNIKSINSPSQLRKASMRDLHFPQHGQKIKRLLALASILSFSVFAQEAPSGNDAATLAKLREATMSSDYAYARLADLTDKIGPRLSGSAGAAAAVTQVADALRALGLKVSLQPVKVPHWVRGLETAELVDYPGRPAGLSQKVVLTALGSSAATPSAGLTAPVLVVHSFDELKARAAEAKGSIVLFDVRFDQGLADSGHAGAAYGQAGMYRFGGPKVAAEMGAVAALVRSVGGADFRIAHTGATSFGNVTPIPAAAVSAEDAMLMTRLSAQGPIRLHLTLTPKTLPDADSFNVIADLPGSEKPDEIVIISGHLDSWDLAHGAIDDGAGVAAAMGAVEAIKRSGLTPKRTIRIVAWMNEENGQRGAQAYEKAFAGQINQHVAAIESDMGAGRPLGIIAGVRPEAVPLFAALSKALLPVGAAGFFRENVIGSGDLSGLEKAGVPSFEPKVDVRSYFHYHHTPADTLDKVEPDNLRRQVAVMGLLAWYLANMPQTPGRSLQP